MKHIAIAAVIMLAALMAHAQGSGEPSTVGQATTPQAASAANRAVEARHQKAVARSQAKAAKRAASAASGAGN